MPVRPLVTLAVTLVALGATACGGGTSGSGGSTDTAVVVGEGKTRYPVTISNCGRDHTFDRAPGRVVLMNGGSVAEVSTILALGVQASVIANAQSYGASDVPGRADAIKALPTGGVALNAQQDIPREAMLGLRPDFVVSTYAGGFSGEAGFASRDDLAKVKANTYTPRVSCGTTGTVTGTPTIEDSYAMLRDFGTIFDVPGKAEQVIAESRKRIADSAARVAGKPVRKVLVVFPGMGAEDFSSIAAAGVWNDVLAKAGGVNPFDDQEGAVFATVSKEKLATTAIDAVIVVDYMNPDPEGTAKKILAQFPQWEATKNQRHLILSDSIYFGPSNDVAVDRIAGMIHADAS